MALDSLDAIVNALANNRQKIPFARTSNLTSQVSGGNSSYWKGSGYPLITTNPSTVVTCNNTTLGGLNFTNPTGGMKTHIGKLVVTATGTNSYELHDRLAHMGGLSGTVTTAQTVNLDLDALASTDNIAERKGKSDYSQVQWWLEWYANTGASAVSCTVNYVNQSGASNTTTVSIPASTQSNRMIPIITTNSGDNIRSITSIQIPTTGTAGNFGVTATVQRTEVYVPIANHFAILDWVALGLPIIYDSSCLFFIALANSATVNSPSGAITLIQG